MTSSEWDWLQSLQTYAKRKAAIHARLSRLLEQASRKDEELRRLSLLHAILQEKRERISTGKLAADSLGSRESFSHIPPVPSMSDFNEQERFSEVVGYLVSHPEILAGALHQPSIRSRISKADLDMLAHTCIFDLWAGTTDPSFDCDSELKTTGYPSLRFMVCLLRCGMRASSPIPRRSRYCNSFLNPLQTDEVVLDGHSLQVPPLVPAFLQAFCRRELRSFVSDVLLRPLAPLVYSGTDYILEVDPWVIRNTLYARNPGVDNRDVWEEVEEIRSLRCQRITEHCSAILDSVLSVPPSTVPFALRALLCVIAQGHLDRTSPTREFPHTSSTENLLTDAKEQSTRNASVSQTSVGDSGGGDISSGGSGNENGAGAGAGTSDGGGSDVGGRQYVDSGSCSGSGGGGDGVGSVADGGGGVCNSEFPGGVIRADEIRPPVSNASPKQTPPASPATTFGERSSSFSAGDSPYSIRSSVLSNFGGDTKDWVVFLAAEVIYFGALYLAILIPELYAVSEQPTFLTPTHRRNLKIIGRVIRRALCGLYFRADSPFSPLNKFLRLVAPRVRFYLEDLVVVALQTGSLRPDQTGGACEGSRFSTAEQAGEAGLSKTLSCVGTSPLVPPAHRPDDLLPADASVQGPSSASSVQGHTASSADPAAGTSPLAAVHQGQPPLPGTSPAPCPEILPGVPTSYPRDCTTGSLAAHEPALGDAAAGADGVYNHVHRFIPMRASSLRLLHRILYETEDSVWHQMVNDGTPSSVVRRAQAILKALGEPSTSIPRMLSTSTVDPTAGSDVLSPIDMKTPNPMDNYFLINSDSFDRKLLSLESQATSAAEWLRPLHEVRSELRTYCSPAVTNLCTEDHHTPSAGKTVSAAAAVARIPAGVSKNGDVYGTIASGNGADTSRASGSGVSGAGVSGAGVRGTGDVGSDRNGSVCGGVGDAAIPAVETAPEGSSLPAGNGSSPLQTDSTRDGSDPPRAVVEDSTKQPEVSAGGVPSGNPRGSKGNVPLLAECAPLGEGEEGTRGCNRLGAGGVVDCDDDDAGCGVDGDNADVGRGGDGAKNIDAGRDDNVCNRDTDVYNRDADVYNLWVSHARGFLERLIPVLRRMQPLYVLSSARAPGSSLGEILSLLADQLACCGDIATSSALRTALHALPTCFHRQSGATAGSPNFSLSRTLSKPSSRFSTAASPSASATLLFFASSTSQNNGVSTGGQYSCSDARADRVKKGFENDKSFTSVTSPSRHFPAHVSESTLRTCDQYATDSSANPTTPGSQLGVCESKEAKHVKPSPAVDSVRVSEGGHAVSIGTCAASGVVTKPSPAVDSVRGSEGMHAVSIDTCAESDVVTYVSEHGREFMNAAMIHLDEEYTHGSGEVSRSLCLSVEAYVDASAARASWMQRQINIMTSWLYLAFVSATGLRVCLPILPQASLVDTQSVGYRTWDPCGALEPFSLKSPSLGPSADPSPSDSNVPSTDLQKRLTGRKRSPGSLDASSANSTTGGGLMSWLSWSKW
eukprot:Rmarinus@m.19278